MFGQSLVSVWGLKVFQACWTLFKLIQYLRAAQSQPWTMWRRRAEVTAVLSRWGVSQLPSVTSTGTLPAVTLFLSNSSDNTPWHVGGFSYFLVCYSSRTACKCFSFRNLKHLFFYFHISLEMREKLQPQSESSRSPIREEDGAINPPGIPIFLQESIICL